MTYLYIILAVFIYIAVGGFIVGITRTKDDTEVFLTIIFWPCFLVFIVIVNIAYLPSKLGEALRAKIIFRRRKK
jgi:uncharacterized membrane protein SirB2